MNEVVVTGGNGFVGRNLRLLCPDWIYLERKNCDLTDAAATDLVFSQYKGYKLVHLAGKVGGLFYNLDQGPVDMYHTNDLINTNVIQSAKKHGLTEGVVLLSTCIYPDALAQKSLESPMRESQIHDGLPHSSNLGYALSKRNLDNLCTMYGTNHTRLVPGNLYGPGDTTCPDRSHLVQGIADSIKTLRGNLLVVKGAKDTRRQFVHVGYLCKVIKKVIETPPLYTTLNVVTGPGMTIQELVDVLLEHYGKSYVKVIWDSGFPVGQKYKECDSSRIQEYLPTTNRFSLDFLDYM